MTVITYNHATFLIARAQQIAKNGPLPTPKHFALPGAKWGVPAGKLEARLAAGVSAHEVAASTRDEWKRINQARLIQHGDWLAGPYRDAIRERREAAQQAAAQEMRLRQAIGRLVAEE